MYGIYLYKPFQVLSAMFPKVIATESVQIKIPRRNNHKRPMPETLQEAEQSRRHVRYESLVFTCMFLIT